MPGSTLSPRGGDASRREVPLGVPFTQVDAFATEAFRGNPAAVVVLPSWPDEGWMQSVATEMNLSETAFVVPQEMGFGLRWFTPAVEVALCGHATLASAWVLWEEHRHGGELIFHTKSGALRCWLREGWIEMDFPATPPVEAAAPVGLAAALGCEPRWVGRSRFDAVVVVDDEDAVRAARPDFGRLREVDARGVMLTAPATPGARYHFVSRFFAPRAGVDEDPVTGSAHCCLAPYWASRLGRPEMVGLQASRRGGMVRVRVEGDRVVLGGRAVPVARGELLVAPAGG
jgi:PhzF family phenazine biosynthesis protein